MGGIYFTNPKDVDILNQILKAIGADKCDVILDFFSGSSTTAHAVLDLNKQDGGNRKFILVQLPEPTYETVDGKIVGKRDFDEAFRAGYKTIADIGKERSAG